MDKESSGQHPEPSTAGAEAEPTESQFSAIEQRMKEAGVRPDEFEVWKRWQRLREIHLQRQKSD
jgi:hypothetical protein